MTTWRIFLPNWKIVTSLAVCGFLAGAVLYAFFLSAPTAVTVIQAGRIGGVESSEVRVSPQLVLDRRSGPQLLVERLQTQEFAQRVADQLRDPSLTLKLAARQYGGNGALRIRQISDGTLVEIRVVLAGRDEAISVANAVADLAISDDKATLADVRAQYQEQIKILSVQAQEASNLASTLTEAVEKNTGSSELASAASTSQDRANQIRKQLWATQSALVQPMSQESVVFAKAAIARPIVRAWWLAAIAGALAGAALGYAIGLSTGRRDNE